MTIDWKNFSILVVEDDMQMREVLCDIFKKIGVQYFAAENGQEALQVLLTKNIHLILSDVQMPVMDGVQLLKEVRSKNKELPIVLLATGQSEITEESALAFGASGLLHKPFVIKVLIERVKQILLSLDKQNSAT